MTTKNTNQSNSSYLSMKKIIYTLIGLVLLISCKENKTTGIQRKVNNYEVVKISAPDLSHISDNGKEVLNLYRFIADEADKIYWKQCFGDKTEMEKLADPFEREYALINYGPWDRITGKSFVKGYGDRPEGANFYPSDMSHTEFNNYDNAAKYSPYTLIRRDENGKLKVSWYHDEYKEHIDKMCNYLTAAADITIKPSVKNYLLKKAEALRTDNYYESNLAWLEMTDSKMDLIVGPNENPDDQLYGLKNSYEAFVLLKDVEKTEEISSYTSRMREFQQLIPCEEKYRQFVPEKTSHIFACDAIYYAGEANAAIKVIALNLPYDTRVQKEKGTRTIIMKNILDEKFNRIVFPTGRVLIEKDQQRHIDSYAFFWNTVFREVSHGLGVKETLDKKVAYNALGNQAFTIEDIKANLLGVFLSCEMIRRHQIPDIITKEDALTTYFANVLRSERFGENGPLGRVNLIIYNYLKEKGGFYRNESGKYLLDYTKFHEGIKEGIAEIMKIQATGDIDAARNLVKKYSIISKEYRTDTMNLGLEGVPVDIRFEFER